MIVLALDMATTTGWAVSRPSRRSKTPVTYGRIDVSRERSLRDKFYYFRDGLRDVLKRHEPDQVWYERPCGHSGAALDLARGFQALLLVELWAKETPAHRVAPNTLKKWATGNGRAGKDDMWQRAVEILDLNADAVLTYDEADAVCLMAYALEQER